MESSLGFIDLSDQCIKAFEKIALENPYAVLTSKALCLALNMMDFFEMNSQKRLLTLLSNCCRHSGSEEDLDSNVVPTLPVLCMIINMRNES